LIRRPVGFSAQLGSGPGKIFKRWPGLGLDHGRMLGIALPAQRFFRSKNSDGVDLLRQIARASVSTS